MTTTTDTNMTVIPDVSLDVSPDPEWYVEGFIDQDIALRDGFIPPRGRKRRPYTLETATEHLEHAKWTYAQGLYAAARVRGAIVALEQWIAEQTEAAS